MKRVGSSSDAARNLLSGERGDAASAPPASKRRRLQPSAQAALGGVAPRGAAPAVARPLSPSGLAQRPVQRVQSFAALMGRTSSTTAPTDEAGELVARLDELFAEAGVPAVSSQALAAMDASYAALLVPGQEGSAACPAPPPLAATTAQRTIQRVENFAALMAEPARPATQPARLPHTAGPAQAPAQRVGSFGELMVGPPQARPVAPVEQATGRRGRALHALSQPVIDQFTRAFEAYMSGASLIECGRQSGVKSFFAYVTDEGQLKDPGKALYGKLPFNVQQRADEALRKRPAALLEKMLLTEGTSEKFLMGLEPYENNASLAECGRQSGLKSFDRYFTDEGQLRDRGEAVYRKLPPEARQRVDEALRKRAAAVLAKMMLTEGAPGKFLKGLEPYGNGASLLECQRQSGLASFKTYVTAEGVLRSAGEAIYKKLPREAQRRVDEALDKRAANCHPATRGTRVARLAISAGQLHAIARRIGNGCSHSAAAKQESVSRITLHGYLNANGLTNLGRHVAGDLADEIERLAGNQRPD